MVQMLHSEDLCNNKGMVSADEKGKVVSKAIRFHQFGDPAVLQWETIEQPQPTDQQLLLKVLAAGVNPIDAKIREGSSFVCEKLTLPSGLGFELCGEVVQLGNHVHGFQIGDMVFGTVGRYFHPCAYAEYVAVNVDDVVLTPQDVDPIQAGAMPIAGTTAWQALHTHGQVKAKQRVLIHAAAGGVGHLAVQLAKQAGAYVVATASARHHDFLKQYGVNELIDYKHQPFEQAVQDVDLVIDLVGGETAIRSFNVLKPNGRIVTVPSYSHAQVLAEAKAQGIDAIKMLADITPTVLSDLAELMAQGQLQVYIAQQFPLSEAAAAHRKLAEKHTQGKLVLVAD